jgi:hypothetical protein
MSVNVHNCCVSVSRGLSGAAIIQWTTTKSLAECQAVLDGHHIVKYRVHCAGEIVETPCYIVCPLVDLDVVGCVFAIEIEEPLHMEGCPA